MSISDLLSLISVGVGTLGVVVAFVFYRLSRRRKQPRFCGRLFRLISDRVTAVQGLQITYLGKSVANVTIARLLFWNAGAETIDGDDLVAHDPLRIQFKDDTNILYAGVVRANNAASRFGVDHTDPQTVRITFEYLDSGHGAVIEFVLDGRVSDFEILGSIKGSEKPLYVHVIPVGYVSNLQGPLFRRIMRSSSPDRVRRAAMALPMLAIVLATGLVWTLSSVAGRTGVPRRGAVLVYAVLITALAGLSVWAIRDVRRFGRRPPADLDAAYDQEEMFLNPGSGMSSNIS